MRCTGCLLLIVLAVSSQTACGSHAQHGQPSNHREPRHPHPGAGQIGHRASTAALANAFAHPDVARSSLGLPIAGLGDRNPTCLGELERLQGNRTDAGWRFVGSGDAAVREPSRWVWCTGLVLASELEPASESHITNLDLAHDDLAISQVRQLVTEAINATDSGTPQQLAPLCDLQHPGEAQTVGQCMVIEEMGRGDIDHDGLEDAVVLASVSDNRHAPHSWSQWRFVALTRRSPNGVLEATVPAPPNVTGATLGGTWVVAEIGERNTVDSGECQQHALELRVQQLVGAPATDPPSAFRAYWQWCEGAQVLAPGDLGPSGLNGDASYLVFLQQQADSVGDTATITRVRPVEGPNAARVR